MNPGFLDSNVLLYSIDLLDHRRSRAETLLDPVNRISVQCLNEFASVARRKLRMPWPKIDEALGIFRHIFPVVVPMDLAVHDQGLAIAQRYTLSVYDGMIIAAALIADCDTLYSEDMHPGLVIAGRLCIENPFAQTPR